MKYLKEPVTNRVVKGKDFGAFFDGWQELTQIEIDAYELGQIKDQKTAQIKSTAAALILATYPTHKQLNTLMSEDSQAIETMDIFISQIRTQSNLLEAALDLLKDPEGIKNFSIKF